MRDLTYAVSKRRFRRHLLAVLSTCGLFASLAPSSIAGTASQDLAGGARLPKATMGALETSVPTVAGPAIPAGLFVTVHTRTT